MIHLHEITPFYRSNKFQNVDADVWLKLDAVQPCGSFKARGMAAACQHFLAQGAKKFISSSGGNAGLAVAWAGRLLNVPVTVVVPESTKDRAKALIALEGAELIVHGESWIEAHALATQLAQDGAALLHPFDLPSVWAGHATMIEEMAGQGPKPDGIVLSVGGGGLLIGVADGLDRAGWGDVEILAVETEGAASLHKSRLAGEPVILDKIETIATTLGAKRVADRAFNLVTSDRVLTTTVTDQQAIKACVRFLDDHRLLVEPACGAALAAVYGHADWLHSKKRIAIIVCGGAGVSHSQLVNWQYPTG